MFNLLAHRDSLFLCLSLGNSSGGILSIKEDSNLLKSWTPGLDEEEVDDKTLNDQTKCSS